MFSPPGFIRPIDSDCFDGRLISQLLDRLHSNSSPVSILRLHSGKSVSTYLSSSLTGLKNLTESLANKAILGLTTEEVKATIQKVAIASGMATFAPEELGGSSKVRKLISAGDLISDPTLPTWGLLMLGVPVDRNALNAELRSIEDKLTHLTKHPVSDGEYAQTILLKKNRITTRTQNSHWLTGVYLFASDESFFERWINSLSHSIPVNRSERFKQHLIDFCLDKTETSSTEQRPGADGYAHLNALSSNELVEAACTDR
jgi:hypothetical protein